jgi:hypothetical protein
MKHIHVGLLTMGAVAIIGLLAVVFAARPVVISPPPTETGASPSDLQCNVKIPGGWAQCGSQASSCKNCHEIKGEDSVNAIGDWHVSHAFGDFCEFCHGGNVQATDKAAAHQGLVQPLGDLQANCSSCHADDYQARAETYAKTLGVTIAVGNNETSDQLTGSAASSAPTLQQPSAPPQTSGQPAPVATPTSSQIVDYVAQYRTERPTPLSAGTIVTSLLLGLTVVGGGSFVYWNERRLRSMPRSPLSQAATADERSQELARLLPILRTLDAPTLRALHTLLSKRRHDN